jgi:predicted RNA-binding protein
MTNPAYWLCLFNPTTWQEFYDAGATVMGFPETRRNTIKRIKPGDYLLGYMTGVSKWMAILAVTSKPYFDDKTKIWKQASFPCRVNVNVINHLDADTGIHPLTLSQKMRLFDHLKSPNWGLLFRTAPRELLPEDGELLIKAIAEAKAAAQTST